jgi:hypothetical protein
MAYVEWQRAEATGTDRRAFSEQSIIQHSAYSGERDRQFRRNVTVAHGWVLRGSDCRRGGHDELFFSSYSRVFRSVTA